MRFFLPIYFTLYLGVAFVVKSVLVARKIGKSPLVLPNDDTAFGLIGSYFKWTILCMFLYILIFAFFPIFFANFLSTNWLNLFWIKMLGVFLLTISFLWTVLAQYHMRHSWRIGIDTSTPTELITTGLFHYSRNPVFLGMMTSLFGLFLVTTNWLTLFFFILGYMLIQIQIRLEETFLTQQHSHNYLIYKQKVRRFL